MSTATTDDNALGIYLKDRRAKLDPKAFGFSLARRRTPGLRREEVAQRANVSATWYTWLEQGRGGVPSTDVLDRIARALELAPVEREHLFLLAQRRPPEVRYQAAEAVTPRVQRVLDALEFSPAMVRTSTWDIVAWNRAAAVVMADYAELVPKERNILRLLFCDPRVRGRNPHWEDVARSSVATFRADVARTGASERAGEIVDELRRLSPEFEAIWLDNDVREHGEGTKHIGHPAVGEIALDYSAFTIDGQPNLCMVVYTPASPADVERVRSLVANAPKNPAPHPGSARSA
jgi:transcriptional regulator with XRE-family HTH domain